MSAFIVSKKTMDIIVNGLIDYMGRDAALKHFKVPHETELGQLLWDMNTASVNSRYNEKDNPQEVYVFSMRELAPSIQFFKSMSCLLYQSNEGDVDKRPEFEKLKKIRVSLGTSLLLRTKEYDAAEWDAN